MPNYQPRECVDYVPHDIYFHRNDFMSAQGSFIFECEEQLRFEAISCQPYLFKHFGLNNQITDICVKKILVVLQKNDDQSYFFNVLNEDGNILFSSPSIEEVGYALEFFFEDGQS